jgi:DAACS family dicarboxylate/amino acid:cation (Na+ or H+) symporter
MTESDSTQSGEARRTSVIASGGDIPGGDEPESRPGGVPLYLWVIGAVLLAIPIGLALRMPARVIEGWPNPLVSLLGFLTNLLVVFPDMLIRGLQALAAPLVVLAILSAIVTNEIHGRQGARMMAYYLINTIVAMTIGLSLVNLIQPGKGARLDSGAVKNASEGSESEVLIDRLAGSPTASRSGVETKPLRTILIESIPRSVGEALVNNNIAQLVVLALPLGIGLARMRNEEQGRGGRRIQTVIDLLSVGFELLMRVLLWIVALVPFAVLGVVAVTLARQGLELFIRLGWFIVVVVAGLVFQVIYYTIILVLFGQRTPRRFFRAAADVMAMTFSTASTAATIPVTLNALTQKLGISRGSSQLAACVGTNFNNDGTALYQAVAAVFLAQAAGANLNPTAQLVVMLTALVASIGAGGIPSGSFVTLPLIFAAVGLSPEQIPILLTVDWFLDRCRTTSNVLGDMTVAVLLDRTAATDADQAQ